MSISEVPILPPKTLQTSSGGVPHNQHLQTSSAPARKNLLTPSLKPPKRSEKLMAKTVWCWKSCGTMKIPVVWVIGIIQWNLMRGPVIFSAIHFNDKSESRVLSKAPKLVETRNRDDTRNRNLCLSPEILSKNLVTSTTTFPTNLCEIYVKMKSSFTFNGNTEVWSNRSPFWGENGVTFFWSFCFSTSAIHSNLFSFSSTRQVL